MKRFVLNVAGLFVAIVAVLFGLTSLYLMAAILWLIPLVSYLMGLLMLGGLDCERTLPLSAAAGESLTLTYMLTNTGRFPKFYLLVRDTLPRGLLLSGPAPLVLALWPGETRETLCQVTARQRGVFAVGPAHVFSTDPLGLQTFSRRLPAVSELVVYPAALPLRDSWLRGAASAGWRGADTALVRGDGDDFYGVRDYGPGDELRRVHWRTTARTGTLAVAEYAQGITLDVTIALDLSQDAYKGTGRDEGSALETAVTLAATLIGDLLRYGHSVRLLTPGYQTESLAARTADALPEFLERLARVDADAVLSLAGALLEDRAGTPRPATIVAITPDWPNPALAEMFQDAEALGSAWFVFALDAASFRSSSPGLPDASGNPNVCHVRRGDDLTLLLEGQAHGRTGLWLD